MLLHIFATIPLLEKLGKWWQLADNLSMLKSLDNLLNSTQTPSMLQGWALQWLIIIPTNQPLFMKPLAKILLHRLDVTDLDSFAVFSETVRQQRNKYLFIDQKMEKCGNCSDKRWGGSVALKGSMCCSTMQELPPSQPGLIWCAFKC